MELLCFLGYDEPLRTKSAELYDSGDSSIELVIELITIIYNRMKITSL